MFVQWVSRDAFLLTSIETTFEVILTVDISLAHVTTFVTYTIETFPWYRTHTWSKLLTWKYEHNVENDNDDDYDDDVDYDDDDDIDND